MTKFNTVFNALLLLGQFLFAFATIQVKGAEGDANLHFVNPFDRLVEFEGWGTSLAWWPDVLGAMPEDVIANITTSFFSSEVGLGLNIVRYTIGGTTPGNTTCGGVFRPGGATESYLDSAGGTYNWTRDARQRDILLRAKQLGVDTFEAFSNSPPQWMTISGCSKGNVGGGLLHSNFDSSRAPEFAKYIADVLEHFSTEWKIDFQTFAPFNEPFGLQGIGGWMGASSSQEGCNMNQATMAETIRVFSDLFTRRNLLVELSVSDETQIDTAIVVQNYFRNQNLTRMIGKINVHGYWDSKIARRDRLYSNTLKDGHRLWMDEMGWGETSLDNMGQGLEIATRIVTDLRNLLPSAWVYWQALEDVGAWGLMSIPYNNATLSNIKYNNGYYALLQFSKYIKKGFSIVYVNEENTVAAYDAKSSRLVLVVVNPDENPAKELIFDLNLFSLNSSTTRVTTRRTSATEQDKNLTNDGGVIDVDLKLLRYTPPAQSVTTILVDNAFLDGTLTSANLIENGDFESPQFEHWAVNGSGVEINTVNSRKGQLSGVINTKDSAGSLTQKVTVRSNADFAGPYQLFLSAWISTTSSSSSGARLSVRVNGVTVGSVTVEGVQYKSYGISVGQVRNGDEVEVVFEAGQDNSVSYIDDVVLQGEQLPG